MDRIGGKGMKEIQTECPACHGTGLYQGMCEQDGCAVVCTKCGGKGYTTFQYNEFTGKKVKEGIKEFLEKLAELFMVPKTINVKTGKCFIFHSMVVPTVSGLMEKNRNLWKNFAVLICTTIKV